MAGAKTDLVSALRSRLADDRAAVTAFSLGVAVPCTSALLEIANGFLVLTVSGSIRSEIGFRWNLSDPRYSTVGRVIAELKRNSAYIVVTETVVASDHPSNDLRLDGMPDIANRNTATFRHRLFSDDELNEFLAEAVALHNPNYTVGSVPRNEHPFVLLKAVARAYRVLASDAARRRGLDTDASVLLKLAEDADTEYARSYKNLARVLPTAKADEGKIGTGDAVQGTLLVRRLRTGYTAPYRSAIPPTPPTLYQPADNDVEDTQVRLRWSQNREQSFVFYELWRDVRPEVERCTAGRLAGYDGPAGLPISTQYSRATTSKQVLGVGMGNRATPVYDGFSFFTAAELSGSSIVNVSFIDGMIFPQPGVGVIALGDPLEPEFDYYYRLYGINWNGEITPSDVIRVRTKKVRGRFKRNTASKDLAFDALTPGQGPLAGGTTVTILGTNFGVGIRAELNGKEMPQVSLTSTQLVVTTPAFQNQDFIGRALDVVLTSPSGLQDIACRVWRYTQ